MCSTKWQCHLYKGLLFRLCLHSLIRLHFTIAFIKLLILPRFLDAVVQCNDHTVPKTERYYRQRAKCGECCKEIDSDQKEKHAKLHERKLVHISTVHRIDSAQSLVSGYFKKQTLNSSSEPQCVSTNTVS